MSVSAVNASAGQVTVRTDMLATTVFAEVSGSNIVIREEGTGRSWTYAARSLNRINFIGGDGSDHFENRVPSLKVWATGGGGHDFLKGSNGNDVLEGGLGDDVLIGGAGADKHFGGSGNDRMWGNAGNDQFYGSYDDDLDGGAGRDILDGGLGLGDTALNGEVVINVP